MIIMELIKFRESFGPWSEGVVTINMRCLLYIPPPFSIKYLNPRNKNKANAHEGNTFETLSRRNMRNHHVVVNDIIVRI